jgi:hypothetical protein
MMPDGQHDDDGRRSKHKDEKEDVHGRVVTRQHSA